MWWLLGLVATLLFVVASVHVRWLRGLVWSGRLPGRLGALPVEQRPAHEAPQAWKCAQLLTSLEGDRVALGGISVGGIYRAEDDAVCVLQRGHQPPALACDCGFYAFEARDRAVALLGRRAGVAGATVVQALCEVEMTGTVIAHDHGFRGQQQRVLGIWVLPWCAPCASTGDLAKARALASDGRPAVPDVPWLDAGGRSRVHPSIEALWDLSPLRPVCASCADRAALTGSAMSLATAASLLGTEVRWLDPDAVPVARVLAGHGARSAR